MVSPSEMKDGAANIIAASAHAITPVTAGGTGDATEVDGTAYDRQVLGAGGPKLWAKLVIHFTAVLAAAATLSIAANMQDDDDDGNGAPTGGWDDFGDALANAVVATGPGGGGTVSGVVELDVPLVSARRWIRAQYTPNLSAANTDTAEMSATWIFGGSNDYPIS